MPDFSLIYSCSNFAKENPADDEDVRQRSDFIRLLLFPGSLNTDEVGYGSFISFYSGIIPKYIVQDFFQG